MNAADKASLSSRREGVMTPEISWQLLPFCLVCRILAESRRVTEEAALWQPHVWEFTLWWPQPPPSDHLPLTRHHPSPLNPGAKWLPLLGHKWPWPYTLALLCLFSQRPLVPWARWSDFGQLALDLERAQLTSDSSLYSQLPACYQAQRVLISKCLVDEQMN